MGTCVSPKNNSVVLSRSRKQNSEDSLAKILNHGFSQTDRYENSELENESKKRADELTNMDESKKS